MLSYGVQADDCAQTPAAMLRRPFRYRRSFMYAAVSDISYIAESIDIKSVGLQYPVWLLCNIDSNTEYS